MAYVVDGLIVSPPPKKNNGCRIHMWNTVHHTWAVADYRGASCPLESAVLTVHVTTRVIPHFIWGKGEDCPTPEVLHVQMNETNGNISFLQLYPTAVAHWLIDTGTAIILAVWSLSEHLSEVMPVGVTISSNISMVIGLGFQQCMWSVSPVKTSMADMLPVINTSCFLKCCYQQVRVILFGTLLSG
jgi:hypothetical protein